MPTEPMPELEAPLQRWLDQVLGAWTLEHGDGPWRVRTAEGPLWVKTLPRGRAWSQVERVHREVLTHLSGVPRRVAAHAELRTIVLTEVPGRPLSGDDAPQCWEELGRRLRALHATPCEDDDPVSLDDALRQRARAAARQQPWADGALRALVDAVPAGRRRVWCHRDLRPPNIRVGAEVGLIDFEHSRPDDPLVDLVRLEAGGWTPAQRSAFLEGWGHTPEPAALRAQLALYGLLTLSWAEAHDDPTFSALGRSALERAGLALPVVDGTLSPLVE